MNKDYDAKGFGGGVYTGYNKQDGQIVYGVEADMNYSGIEKSYKGVEADQGLNGSLRARVGYDLSPALVYATGGLAATNLEVTDKTSDSNKTLLGVTLGAGVETKITESITARTEYRFTNYQTQTFNLDSGATDRGLKEHQVNVGLGLKF
jgi:outer membrane immunogenic protein